MLLLVIQRLFVVVCDCLPLCVIVLPYIYNATDIGRISAQRGIGCTSLCRTTTTKYNTAAANKSDKYSSLNLNSLDLDLDSRLNLVSHLTLTPQKQP
jgi:hypothetical protein